MNSQKIPARTEPEGLVDEFAQSDVCEDSFQLVHPRNRHSLGGVSTITDRVLIWNKVTPGFPFPLLYSFAFENTIHMFPEK